MISEFEKANKLFTQGRCLQAEEILQQIPISSADFLPSQCLLLCCYADQGKIGRAVEFARQLEKEFSFDYKTADVSTNENLTKLYIWIYFIRLYSKPIGNKLILICKKIFADNCSYDLKTLAMDLKTRSEIFAVMILGGYPLEKSQETAARFDSAVKAYEQANLFEESLYAKFRKAVFCCGRGRNLYSLADKLLREIFSVATTALNLTLAADASLYMAELNFIKAHNNLQNSISYQKLAEKFEESANLFLKADHPYPEEKAVLRFGLLLLEYGFEEGVKIVTDCFPKIEENENYTLIQEGWRQLHLWHIHHGNISEVKKCQNELNRLNEKMQFGLSISVDELGKGDSALRQGKVVAALEHLEKNEQSYSTTVAVAARFISATVMSSVGLTGETRQEFDEIIRNLEKNGNLQLIAEAWTMYALSFINEDLPKAIECLTNAIKAVEFLNSPTEIGKSYALRAYLKTLNNHRQKSFPSVTEEVEFDYDCALEKLQNLRTLEGRNALISMCQMRGQSALMEKNWKVCGHWLTKAEELAEALKLHPQTAFSIIYQGLALIEIARTQGAESYAPAFERFCRAEKIFVEAGITGQVWRTLFYQGLCKYESGVRTELGNPPRIERFDEADGLLKKAVDEINDLRGLASSDEILQSYKINLSMGADKQEVYRTGFNLNWRYRNSSKDVFWWLEQMKARALIKTLTEKLPPADGVLENEAVIKEIELQKAFREETDSEKRENLREERRVILSNLESSSAISSYILLKRGEPIGWRSFREYLSAQQAKLESGRLVIAQYYCTPELTMLITMRADWESLVYELLPVNYEDLRNFVNRRFYTKNALRYMLTDIGEDQWQQFSPLVAPISLHSEPKDIICLIPHGILHNLPLHTLFVEGTRLIERNPVFYSPSASLLSYQNRFSRPNSANRKKISVFGNATKDLAFAEAEAKAVAEKFGIKAKLRDEVTTQSITEAFATSEIIHYAGHAELSAADGFQSKLFLAEKKFLTATDILDFSIQSDLIVLSGCETGLNVYNTGDELTGLTSSFLAAGAKSMIVSQWRVDDESSKSIFSEFYRIWHGQKKVRKVTALQKALLETAKISDRRSFYYWGGFVLYGDWY